MKLEYKLATNLTNIHLNKLKIVLTFEQRENLEDIKILSDGFLLKLFEIYFHKKLDLMCYDAYFKNDLLNQSYIFIITSNEEYNMIKNIISKYPKLKTVSYSVIENEEFIYNNFANIINCHFKYFYMLAGYLISKDYFLYDYMFNENKYHYYNYFKIDDIIIDRLNKKDYIICTNNINIANKESIKIVDSQSSNDILKSESSKEFILNNISYTSQKSNSIILCKDKNIKLTKVNECNNELIFSNSNYLSQVNKNRDSTPLIYNKNINSNIYNDNNNNYLLSEFYNTSNTDHSNAISSTSNKILPFYFNTTKINNLSNFNNNKTDNPISKFNLCDNKIGQCNISDAISINKDIINNPLTSDKHRKTKSNKRKLNKKYKKKHYIIINNTKDPQTNDSNLNKNKSNSPEANNSLNNCSKNQNSKLNITENKLNINSNLICNENDYNIKNSYKYSIIIKIIFSFGIIKYKFIESKDEETKIMNENIYNILDFRHLKIQSYEDFTRKYKEKDNLNISGNSKKNKRRNIKENNTTNDTTEYKINFYNNETLYNENISEKSINKMLNVELNNLNIESYSNSQKQLSKIINNCDSETINNINKTKNKLINNQNKDFKKFKAKNLNNFDFKILNFPVVLKQRPKAILPYLIINTVKLFDLFCKTFNTNLKIIDLDYLHIHFTKCDKIYYDNKLELVSLKDNKCILDNVYSKYNDLISKIFFENIIKTKEDVYAICNILNELKNKDLVIYYFNNIINNKSLLYNKEKDNQLNQLIIYEIMLCCFFNKVEMDQEVHDNKKEHDYNIQNRFCLKERLNLIYDNEMYKNNEKNIVNEIELKYMFKYNKNIDNKLDNKHTKKNILEKLNNEENGYKYCLKPFDINEILIQEKCKTDFGGKKTEKQLEKLEKQQNQQIKKIDKNITKWNMSLKDYLRKSITNEGDIKFCNKKIKFIIPTETFGAKYIKNNLYKINDYYS